ncbi:TPA: DNA methylase [Vibrio vulnificus]|nr:DNA methylase [Vibrio vulnificus]
MKQENLFGTENEKKDSGPVECLGMTFESDEARRTHFTALLREKLKDPEFRAIEGFPIGTDEAILELSDPPYYTACPNPWLNNFIERCCSQNNSSEDVYHREPFAADVSEGRSGLFYDAHSYHTKVPHKAIMRYILHYTAPGDIVLDSFSGTGMTGVAAQLCNDESIIEELGYDVKNNGDIYDSDGVLFSKLGKRHAILSDLSPVASNIAYNYNKSLDVQQFEIDVEELFNLAESNLGWVYNTLAEVVDKNDYQGIRTQDLTEKIGHEKFGKINYIIWSEVFECKHCSGEFNFWEVTVKNSGIEKEIVCPHCSSKSEKRNLDRVYSAYFDNDINDLVRVVKTVPVRINYTYRGKRFEKQPDWFDLKLIEYINGYEIDSYYPTSRMIEGQESRRNDKYGLTHVHQFYTRRSLLVLSKLRAFAKGFKSSRRLNFLISSYDMTHSTKMSRIIFKNGGKKPVLTGYQSGTLYISSLPVEKNILSGILGTKKKSILDSFSHILDDNYISNSSATSLSIKDNSIDYVFIDPPFGANLNYSELNVFWEEWLELLTNNSVEAIENKKQGKDLNVYRNLMTRSFKEIYRVLKPGRWLTVEFSNTKASVWNSIQTAISEAGFVVANVSALDKKQGSFKAVTTSTAVKQDLVISAYKPDIDKTTVRKLSSNESVIDFLSSHLKYLPVTKFHGDTLIKVPERDVRILFDQVVSYYFRNGENIPISAIDFQKKVIQGGSFEVRDEQVFLPFQAVEYDKKRMLANKVTQMSIFVHDEATAIEWLRNLLTKKPSTYSEIHPLFINELSGWKKSELQLELDVLLEQNFLKYKISDGEVPIQVHSYLSKNYKSLRGLDHNNSELRKKANEKWYVPDITKSGDLEKVRNRSLLKEFDSYLSQKKLKVVRTEALRVGFRKLWDDREYQPIVDICTKLSENILQEDEVLTMYYDNALTMTQNFEEDW